MNKQIIENALDYYRDGLMHKLKIAQTNNHQIEIKILTHQLSEVNSELKKMNSIFLHKNS